MDEIFGQSNFVADMVWAAGRKNDSRLVSVSHEYIVCYARDSEYLRENG
jgi:adenine-specific DNA-methyltransferase